MSHVTCMLHVTCMMLHVICMMLNVTSTPCTRLGGPAVLPTGSHRILCRHTSCPQQSLWRCCRADQTLCVPAHVTSCCPAFLPAGSRKILCRRTSCTKTRLQLCCRAKQAWRACDFHCAAVLPAGSRRTSFRRATCTKARLRRCWVLLLAIM